MDVRDGRAAAELFPVAPEWRGPAEATTCSAFADVDGDGDLDLVRGNYASGASLYLNNDNVFASTPAWTGLARNTMSVALGDINGDGLPDLVCGNLRESSSLYLNIGGNFSSSPSWEGRVEATFSVALGDVDGDGDLDLVCGNYATGAVMYLNNGGTFDGSPIWRGQPGSTEDIALGDIDGDGDLDLVCGNYDAGSTLYLNTGAAFAGLPAWTGPVESTVSIGLGDINGDGFLDLVRGNFGFPDTAATTLSLNIGGSFSDLPDWAGPAEATQEVALGDVDGDGDLDLVLGNYESASTIYLNRDGTIEDSSAFRISAGSTLNVALADIDGDGSLDLIQGAYRGESTLYRNTGATRVRFGLLPTVSGPAENTFGVALGDIDGDGAPDLVRGNYLEGATLHLNTGGTFEATAKWTGPPEATSGVALGDIDGDGALDLVRGNTNGGATLYLNIGGTFADTAAWTGPAEPTSSVALGDVDGDGDLDLVRGNLGAGATLYLNTGGTFTDTAAWTGPAENTASVALGDVDSDGDLDLVCGGSRGASYYRNTNGIFSRTPTWRGSFEFTNSVALGDVDGDGHPDLACGNRSSVSTIYLNIGGTFDGAPAWTFPTRNTFGVALTDADGDGDPDFVCANYATGSEMYLNTGGTFESTANWTGQVDNARSVALRDVDGDGLADLVFGNQGKPTTLYASSALSLYSGAPFRSLPNSPPRLRGIAVRPSGVNRYSIRVAAVDAESDPIRIKAEFKLAGTTVWTPMSFDAVGTDSGTLTSSPTGVEHGLSWDISLLPFSSRDMVTRLTVSSPLQRVGAVQAILRHQVTAGHIVPERAEFATLPDTLHFTSLTVGDSVQQQVSILNSGTADLIVAAIESSDAEVIPQFTPPLVIAPRATRNVSVIYAPRSGVTQFGRLRLRNNDPFRPTVELATQPGEVLTLRLGTQMVATEDDSLALGQPARLLVIPFPQVHFRKVQLFIRKKGATGFRDSVECGRLGTNFLARIPGAMITEGGIEYYVRGENSGLFAFDPAGAPLDTNFFSKTVTQPASISSVPVADATGDFPRGRVTRVHVALPPGTQFERGSLHYRQAGAAQFDSVSLTVGGTSPAAETLVADIPAASVGTRGVEYWVSVATSTSSLSDPAQDPAQNPLRLRTQVDNLSEPSKRPGGTYRMVTVPLDLDVRNLPGDSSLENLLAAQPEFGPYDITRWRSFRFDPSIAIPDYREITPTNTATGKLRPEPGRAFWLVTRDSTRVSTGAVLGRSTATDRPFQIQLEKGWNQVGNPYDFPVAWASVSASNSSGPVLSLQSPEAFDGATGLYDLPAVTVLRPFEGYWVRNPTDGPVQLLIPPVEFPEVEPALLPGMAEVTAPGIEIGRRALAPDPRAWKLQIAASCSLERMGHVLAGVTALALDGDDPLDRWQPPPAPGPGSSVYLAGSRPYDRLAADLRSPITNQGESDTRGQHWSFDVARTAADAKPSEVTLAISGLGQVPEGIELRLVDRVLDRVVDLRQESTYRCAIGGRQFVTSEAEARFALIAGTPAFVDAVQAAMTAPPRASRLLTPYPNPLVGTSLIRYEVGRPGKVALEVYDFAGRRVRTLASDARVAGKFEVLWGGDSDAGQRLPPGIYMLRLKGPDRSDAKKLVLVR
jgi:hypothetical protein